MLNEQSQRASQNNKIKTILKPHQLASIYRANILETQSEIKIEDTDNTTFNTECGVISDNVGSGKSLTILGIISNNIVLYSNKLISFSAASGINIFKNPINNNDNYLKTNFLVVPHNILKQWQKYIVNDTNLKYLTISNAKDLNNSLYIDKIKYCSVGSDKSQYLNKLQLFENYDLILISSTRYNEVSDHLTHLNSEIVISRLIFDEADSIKISGCRNIKSKFTWLITSSYNVINNPQGFIKYANINGDTQSWYSWNSGYTKRIVENGIQCRGYIKNLCINISNVPSNINKQLFVQNEIEYIKKSFLLIPPKVNTILCKDPPIFNVLNNIASENIMGFINAGDINGAINSLNCTKVKEDSLISLVTEELNTELHNKKIELQAKQAQIFSSEKNKKDSIKKIQEKILDLEEKIQNLKNKLEESSTCPVCYDSIENIALCGTCNTKFCVECITTWITSNSSINNGNSKCPFCRNPLTMNSLIVVSDIKEKEQSKDKLIDKIRNLNILLNNHLEEKSKILIFSNYDGTFNKIFELLVKNNTKFSKIMGSSSHISNVVEKFNKNFDDPSSVNVLLLNSKYFGSGLNLQNADHIILYHNMNNDITKQVVGRAQRPGRKNQLNIWRLCHSTEISGTFVY